MIGMAVAAASSKVPSTNLPSKWLRHFLVVHSTVESIAGNGLAKRMRVCGFVFCNTLQWLSVGRLD